MFDDTSGSGNKYEDDGLSEASQDIIYMNDSHYCYLMSDTFKQVYSTCNVNDHSHSNDFSLPFPFENIILIEELPPLNDEDATPLPNFDHDAVERKVDDPTMTQYLILYPTSKK